MTFSYYLGALAGVIHWLTLLMNTNAHAAAEGPSALYSYHGNAFTAFLTAVQNGWHFVWTDCTSGPCY